VLAAVAAIAVPSALASPARHSAAVSPNPGVYNGMTSQGFPVQLDVVSNSPDYIDSWSIGFTLTCRKSHRTENVGMGFSGFNVPIGSDGTFSFNYLSFQFYFQWAGKFTSSTTVQGTASTVWAAMRDPKHSETCRSGSVSWNASQGGSAHINPDSYDLYFAVTKDAQGHVHVRRVG
jgi:hypothetical protein